VAAERHPIPEDIADLSDRELLRRTRIDLARLWDQVWWMNLSEDERAAHRATGHDDPITNFYEKG